LERFWSWGSDVLGRGTEGAENDAVLP